MKGQKIYISGLYSGPSPSAGLGIARCLREGFPDAHLVGIDHWSGSSGLHHPVLNERLVLPGWDNIDKTQYLDQVSTVLEQGGIWISAHDIEVDFLGRHFSESPRLLVPSAESYQLTCKPKIRVKELFPFRVPPQIFLDASDAELYAFCREHSWRVWLKGPYHEAFAITQWRDFETARRALQRQWSARQLVLQAHVRGYEESLCFSAVKGEILEMVMMEKRVTTAEGKTWSGHVRPPSDELGALLTSVARQLNWHGGAEIELIRDADDALWLMEWNPRFPAWIYGACLAGRNLPAALVARTLGEAHRVNPNAVASEFTRVVTEIPVLPQIRLPLPKEPVGLVNAGKYGAGLSDLAHSLNQSAAASPGGRASEVEPRLLHNLSAVLKETNSTPERIFLDEIAESYFKEVAEMARTHSRGQIKLSPAYSFKTSPDQNLIDLCRKFGFRAECISQLEVQRALQSGFAPHEIVLNGPGKWWPQELSSPPGLKALFCDSNEELARVLEMDNPAQVIGLRVRVPSLNSRFGIALGDFAEFQRSVHLIATAKRDFSLGLHFHMASSAIGVNRWFDSLDGALALGRALSQSVERPLKVVDLGGGWLREDFQRVEFSRLLERIQLILPEVGEVIIEPGKALTQETMALRTRILDLHQKKGQIDEIVVDACIAELPLSQYYPHRALLRRSGSSALEPLAFGDNRILGRICMEDDVLSRGVLLPQDVAIGDDIIFLDSGAYERSMSYDFGRGGF